MLEEPTGALDPISIIEIEELIDDVKQPATIALITIQQATRCFALDALLPSIRIAMPNGNGNF